MWVLVDVGAVRNLNLISAGGGLDNWCNGGGGVGCVWAVWLLWCARSDGDDLGLVDNLVGDSNDHSDEGGGGGDGRETHVD